MKLAKNNNVFYVCRAVHFFYKHYMYIKNTLYRIENILSNTAGSMAIFIAPLELQRGAVSSDAFTREKKQ